MTKTPDPDLSDSISSDALTALSGLADITLDAAIDSEMLNGIPIIGTLISTFRAGKDIRNRLFLRKITIFLQELSSASTSDRTKFAQKFGTDEARYRFGETIILLLERAESMEKPRIVGRILCACIEGKIEYRKAMRLAAIVDRCYVPDLDYLKGFTDGTQKAVPIAESLLAAGLLSNGGLDGGTDGDEGGVIFNMNEYGKLLVKHGLRA